VGGVHFGGYGAGEQKCSSEVCVDYAAEEGRGVGDGVGFAGYGGAVDEAADGGAEGWAESGEGGLDAGFVLDVGLDVGGGGAVGLGGGFEGFWMELVWGLRDQMMVGMYICTPGFGVGGGLDVEECYVGAAFEDGASDANAYCAGTARYWSYRSAILIVSLACTSRTYNCTII
jgi:hypothetical protein